MIGISVLLLKLIKEAGGDVHSESIRKLAFIIRKIHETLRFS